MLKESSRVLTNINLYRLGRERVNWTGIVVVDEEWEGGMEIMSIRRSTILVIKTHRGEVGSRFTLDQG